MQNDINEKILKKIQEMIEKNGETDRGGSSDQSSTQGTLKESLESSNADMLEAMTSPVMISPEYIEIGRRIVGRLQISPLERYMRDISVTSYKIDDPTS